MGFSPPTKTLCPWCAAVLKETLRFDLYFSKRLFPFQIAMFTAKLRHKIPLPPNHICDFFLFQQRTPVSHPLHKNSDNLFQYFGLNIAKSNESELCHIQKSTLPFRNICKIQHQSSFKLNDLARPKWRFKKKMTWDNSVSPIDAINSIGFLWQFFWVSLDF